MEDCKDPVIKFEKGSVYFRGHGGVANRSYEVTLELFGEINAAVSDGRTDKLLTLCECGTRRVIGTTFTTNHRFSSVLLNKSMIDCIIGSQ